jgi:hypothetical protein
MSDTAVTVRASTERQTDFEKQIDEQIAMHILADALEPKRAARLLVDVMFAAIIQENNLRELGGNAIDPDGTQRKQWDRTGAVEHVISNMKALSVYSRHVSHVINDILSICFDASRNCIFLDTDEIPNLVGISYGVGIAVERELRETACEWLTGGDE